MDDANATFEKWACPHSWLLCADNLHTQAVFLYEKSGDIYLTEIDDKGNSKTWKIRNKSVFLLGGFALENAIKAFLVYENPEWISNGRLSSNLRSHSLTRLQSQSSEIPYKNKLVWVLRGFEEGLESWARYPCALSVKKLAEEAQMGAVLWRGYLRLMSAYGKKLKKLLRREWHGPHHFRGRYTFKGDFLSL